MDALTWRWRAAALATIWRGWSAALLAFLVVSSLLRGTLLGVHGVLPTASQLIQVLGRGFVLDLVAGGWLLLPTLLACLLVPTAKLRRLRSAVALAATFAGWWVLGLLSVAELLFFLEFDGRFNFVAVDYLIFPTEVAVNIWESYPTGWILSALTGLALGLTAVSRRALRPTLPPEVFPGLGWSTKVAGFASVLALWSALTAVIPADWNRATGDRALDEIADNGPRAFAHALGGVDAPYRGLFAEVSEPEMWTRLRRLLDEPSLAAGSTARPVRSRPARIERLNVVVVLEESLGAEFVGALEPASRLTPAFDELATQGVLWTQAYATGNRTIRAIEATTSSLPPLPGISIVRRPRSVGLATLPSILRDEGYRTLFVYGGRALFDGVGKYLQNNGVERVVDEGDFPSGEFRTAWGVSDHALFGRALDEMDRMDAAGESFYTLVLTTSNHRPFRFPEGQIRADPTLGGRQNAVRYADWALGEFVREARRRPYFDRTLFVLMGDHGARVYGASRIPLASYRVPVLLLAPSKLPPARLATLASSMDVPPTVLGILGLAYESRFFGQDVLAVDPERGRALMTHNNSLALMRGGRLAILGLRGSREVYRCDAAPVECVEPEPAGTNPASDLVGDAIAYFQGADTVYRSGAYATNFGLASRARVASAAGRFESHPLRQVAGQSGGPLP